MSAVSVAERETAAVLAKSVAAAATSARKPKKSK